MDERPPHKGSTRLWLLRFHPDQVRMAPIARASRLSPPRLLVCLKVRPSVNIPGKPLNTRQTTQDDCKVSPLPVPS